MRNEQSRPIRMEPGTAFPLTTMQQGMLFNALKTGDPGVDLQQFVCSLREDLDVDAFTAAWRRVVDRHIGLRMSFHWQGLAEPRQVVSEAVDLPFARRDWRSLEPSHKEQRLLEFVRSDRRRGFDVTRAPLMRFLVVNWDEGEYRVVWTLHHMLSDGRSYILVLREVFEIYEALRRNEEPDLPAPAPYERFLRWLEERDRSTLEPFWRRRLKGFREPTPLPLGYRGERSEDWGTEEETEKLRLPREVVDRFYELGKPHGWTPHSFVQGGWALLLFSYTGVRDVVFGSIRAGRKGNVPDTRGMVGAFFNNLPVRLRVEPNRPLSEWLDDLRAHVVELRQGEHTPFPDLQKWSDIPPGRRLFETLVSFERFDINEWLRGLGGPWKFRSFRIVRKVGYPLSLGANLDEGLLLTLTFARSRYRRTDAKRLLRTFASFLTKMTQHAEGRLYEVMRLPDPERAVVLTQWNDTGGTELPETPLAAGLDAQAQVRPESVAVVEGEACFTFAQLHRLRNHWARCFRRMGVGPEKRIALVLERGVERAAAQEAIWRAGGVLVPLSPTDPPERLAWILRSSSVEWVLTSEDHRTRVRQLAPRQVRVISPGDVASMRSENEPAGFPDAGPESLAYVIFTSGSTGRPKGVMVRRGSLIQHARAVRKRYALTPEDRVLQLAAPGFDVAMEELFPTLWAGACVVFPPPEARSSVRVFLRTSADRGVTVINLPTSFWNEWVNHLDGNPVPPNPELRLVVLGSEPVRSHSLDRWREIQGDGLEIHNAYGLTETTITDTVHRVGAPATADENGLVPIGKPLEACRAYVVDVDLDLLPSGARGMLAISGSGVARGYLADPKRTAESFRPNPHADEPGSRLLVTGDLARFRDDGSLDFLGRSDQQVKIRGLRIEPGEIESVVTEHPQVAEAVVMLQEEKPGEGYLAAYLVPARESALSDAELRSFLEDRLLPAMVPAVFVVLPDLPRTPSGKLDRRALPEPEPVERSVSAPRTPVEILVATLWSEVLEEPRIGRDENFFALGGHSLRAARVLTRVARELSVELPVRALFEHPTVAGLAREIETVRRGHGNAGGVEPLEPCPDPSLSFGQERLWFQEQLEGGGGIYNVPLGLRIEGRVGVRNLEQALVRIVARHQPLGSRIVEHDGEPRIEVESEPRLRLPVVDLWELTPDERAEELRRNRRREVSHSFDLTLAPQLRGEIFRLEEKAWFLQLNIHHIAFDGGSEGVFLRELGAVYTEGLAGRPARLPALPVRYGDFAAWQRRVLRGEVLEDLWSYWDQSLAGSSHTLDLPTDRPRSSARRFTGAKRFFSVPESTWEAVTALARSRAVTPFMVTLAGFALVLSRYSGQTDLLLGAPVSLRDRRELEGLVGLFTNLLALRVVVRRDFTGDELLEQVRETVLGAYDHRDLPFERIVQKLVKQRDPQQAPLVQVVLAFDANPRAVPRFPGLTVHKEETDSGKTKFDLTLSVDIGETEVVGSLGYRTDLFTEVTVQRLLGHWLRLLGMLAGSSSRPVGSLSMLSPAERHQLLVEWNGRRAPYPRTASLAEVFEGQASERPDSVAVVSDEHQVTYGELDRASDRLAVALQEHGVGPNVQVAVLLDRSVETLMTLLGILKAGGAYLPLDPVLPPERLRRMLADGGARLVVTDRPGHEGLPKGLQRVIPSEIEVVEGAEPVQRAGGRDLAYLLYTSGSTGDPKGVAVEQRSVLRLVRGTEYARFGSDEVFLQVAQLSFDASTFEIWGSLLNGGRLVLFSEHHTSLAKLADALTRFGVTTLWLTAALFHQMVDNHLPELARVRQLLAGGDRLSSHHVRRVFGALEVGTLTNGYGPTEATTFTTCHLVGSEIESTDAVPIGRPITNTRIYVLDHAGEPVPVGVPGELWVGGVGVARGYWQRPRQTAESFRPDPFGWRPGGRLYRTGDQVRYRTDGILDFLGRFDDQVKVRGFRVEPGEVQVTLAAHPEVRSAVVVPMDSPSGRELVGYVVPRGDDPLPRERLRGHLAETLPGYMIPAFLVSVPELPVSATGKVDRRELLQRYPPVRAGKRREPPDLSPFEARIAEIWSKVLDLHASEIGPSDDFFDLGGHSLKATRILARVRQELGVSLSVEALFQLSTLGEFAARVERSMGDAGNSRGESPIAALPRQPRSRRGAS